jgi:glycosyltransferase involved in cell wall biosynthesis
MSTAVGKEPKIILLLIRSLNIGGAERQVVSLAKSISTLGTEVHVAVKAGGGPLEIDLASVPNVQLHHLGERGTVGQFKYFLKLRKLIKTNRYDAVYGFMPLPNLALLIAHTLRNRPLITWGVRSSDVDANLYDDRVKWTMRLEKWLSKFADRVITNSEAALGEYRQNGYPYSKLAHVPNAIDVERFRPNPDARISIRNKFGISNDAPVVGIFARLHPMKDHTTFLRAAKILVETMPNARFICAGGTSPEDSNYEQRIKANTNHLGLENHVLWLGPRTDPEDLMAACDLTTLTSDSGEGFPNSVAESMACGVPCVVTDIGDASKIASTYGATVQPGDPDKLAAAWNSALETNRSDTQKIAQESRSLIIERYSTAEIAQKTLALLIKS